MSAPSKNFSTISNATLTAGQPWTQALTRQFRDNDEHLEEWLGADYTAAQNHDHDGINSKEISLGGQNIFLNDNGDGSNGTVNQTVDANYDSGVYNCVDFTLAATKTITKIGDGPLIIRATGTITINGTIDASGKGNLGGKNGVGSTRTKGYDARHGGPISGGGGGGGGTADGGGSGWPTIQGGAGARNPGSSADPGTPAAEMRVAVILLPFSWSGGGGGGSGGASSTGAGGDGGDGGGMVALIAPTIVLGASAVIDCGGTAGTGGVVDSGGGGGGGGGVIILAYDGTSGGFTDGTSGAYDDVTAGAAGSGNGSGTNGVAGAAGWSTEIDREA